MQKSKGERMKTERPDSKNIWEVTSVGLGDENIGGGEPVGEARVRPRIGSTWVAVQRAQCFIFIPANVFSVLPHLL